MALLFVLHFFAQLFGHRFHDFFHPGGVPLQKEGGQRIASIRQQDGAALRSISAGNQVEQAGIVTLEGVRGDGPSLNAVAVAGAEEFQGLGAVAGGNIIFQGYGDLVDALLHLHRGLLAEPEHLAHRLRRLDLAGGVVGMRHPLDAAHRPAESDGHHPGKLAPQAVCHCLHGPGGLFFQIGRVAVEDDYQCVALRGHSGVGDLGGKQPGQLLFEDDMNDHLFLKVVRFRLADHRHAELAVGQQNAHIGEGLQKRGIIRHCIS